MLLDSGRYILKRIHVATCVVGEAQWLLGLDAERHERRGDEPVALEYLGGQHGRGAAVQAWSKGVP